MKKNSINIQTAEVYEGYIRGRVLPKLGHVLLAQLSPMLIQSYINDLAEEGLASDTIKKLHTLIKGSLEHAVNMELLPSNPAKKIQLPKSGCMGCGGD